MMTGGRGGYGAVARQVGKLFGGGSAVGLGEDRLLARFVLDRDEAAFESLVSRHGPMVLGTCRRMLADPRDVEDAFQATFLVLARRAGSIQDPDRLGPWLHGVARRVATRSRALAARRASMERTGGEDHAVAAPESSLEGIELRSVLDEELSRLPEKYRAPLVLCYLEGLTHDEAARHLRWPVGTVRSRLAGGRDRLKTRLTRRGLAPPSASLPIAALSPHLLTTTTRLATTAGTVPAPVAALAKGAMIAMTASKLKALAALGLMAGLAAGGVGAIAQQVDDGRGVAPAGPASSLAPDDLARLQGEWKLREVLPARGEGFLRSQNLTWSIRGTLLIPSARGKVLHHSELRLGVGGDGRARTIDLIKPLTTGDEGGESISLGLYRFVGEALEVCLGAPASPRPENFQPAKTGLYPSLFTFDRSTPEPPTAARPAAKSDPFARAEAKAEFPADDVWKERAAVEINLGLIQSQMEKVKSESKAELDRLGATTAELRARAATLDQRLKARSTVLERRYAELVAKADPAPARGPAIPGPANAVEGGAGTLPPSDALAKLQGEWKLVDFKPSKDSGLTPTSDIRWSISGTRWASRFDGEEKGRGEVKLGTRGGDATIDLDMSMDDGGVQARRGLYRIEGDRLEVCLNGPQPDRPDRFEAGVDGTFPHLLTFRHQGPAGRPAEARAEAPKPAEAAARGGQGRGVGPAGPMRMNLGESKILLVPAERDRATVVDIVKGTRETYKAPAGVTEIVPIVGSGLVALMLQGPAVTQAAVYDLGGKGWVTHEIPKGVTEVTPIFGQTTVALMLKGSELTQATAYVAGRGWISQELREPARGQIAPIVAGYSAYFQSGRFVYVFSAFSKKWGVVELKQQDASRPGGAICEIRGRKFVVIDGDLIHTLDLQTGEGTVVDTGEKEGK